MKKSTKKHPASFINPKLRRARALGRANDALIEFFMALDELEECPTWLNIAESRVMAKYLLIEVAVARGQQ